MTASVLFCDPHLLVVEKPAGMLTQPTLYESDSVESFGKRWLEKEFNKERAFLEVIGRLDRPVSGLLLCARRSKSLSRLQEAMRACRFEKRYLALVEGRLAVSSGEMEHRLIHGDHKAILDPEGKSCCLSYRTLEERGETTLVEITLRTGRYHQIRAQFAASGHPIVGDVLYGSTRFFAHGIALHHCFLRIPHPMTQEMVEWSCLPKWLSAK